MAVREADAALTRRALDLLRRRGIDCAPILEEVGLDEADLAARESRVPCATGAALLQAIARVLDDPCFGLHLGHELRPRDLGLLGYISVNAPTLEVALRKLSDLLPLFYEGSRSSLEPAQDGAWLVWSPIEPAVAACHHCDDLAMSVALRLCRHATRRAFAPLQVDLRHERIGSAGLYRRIFHAPVLFGCETTRLLIPREILACRLPDADPGLLDLLEGYAEEIRRRRRPEGDLVAEVQEEVLDLLPSGAVSVDTVARRLRTSPRTLHRRLRAAGTSFGEIVDGLRRELALGYVREGGPRLKTVAGLLGYQEVSAFSHAFRRWTGTTPSSYRQLAA
ncbi:MAG: AraC family transcriptional regulator [Geminicoccaceae bacterium]